MSACSVCSSRHVGAIEAALSSGESKSAIGRRYGVSRFAIARHAEHTVEGVLVEANRPVLEGRLHDLDARLVGLEAVLQRTLDQAIAAGKATTLVATARELRMTIESIAKLRGQLDERPVVNLAVMPEVRALTSRLLDALLPYPEARFAAAAALAGVSRSLVSSEEPVDEKTDEKPEPPLRSEDKESDEEDGPTHGNPRTSEDRDQLPLFSASVAHNGQDGPR